VEVNFRVELSGASNARGCQQRRLHGTSSHDAVVATVLIGA
jgi:hypothetical protein